MLFTLLAFAVAIGLLVTIHELGHYWIARRCGVHIERFSFGFGKVLAKYTDKRGCEWAFSALPLGGYVMMRNQAPLNATQAEIDASFDNKTVWQRAAITVAGPVANLILAVLIYALIGLVGTQEPAAILGQPAADTPAAYAHVQAGDTVVGVNDKNIASWSQFRWQMLDSLSTGGVVNIQTQDALSNSRTYEIDLPKAQIKPDAPDLLAEAGFRLAMPHAKVQRIIEGGAAEAAGLLAGDVIVGLNDIPEPSANDFVSAVQNLAGQTVQLQILRDGQRLSIDAHVRAEQTPEGEQVGRIGILVGADLPMVTVRYGPLDSVVQGVSRTADTFWLSLKMIARMVTGDVSVKNISGPVSIADYAGQSARIGLASYLHFLALISVSIGLLNLLPIPMLDGGHLLYYAVEVVRGRPLSEKWQNHGRRIGLGILAALMMLAFVNDFVRLFS
ncbi:RIP metalloprotease RseP [Paenalcaligenes niemegkensis]|uniref:RIP metalloprotease RseP n=1 Tax=Paenalcaligenes niemegkensis TaxID=2895469 RepID=UPI001EE7DCBA|nr:RIP metalloprotease RseP [Paenalcaligenes niemegkensis]MCQ9616290.1 RIP metalloprotease RseP [Paenalcaligenes niemegkensis]